VITNDTIVPDNALALGIPAKIKEGMDNRAHIEDGAAWYVENGKRYRETLKRLL
jgi:carbonic anhydrase/acetyltransferase-like protein (isoleucine patch superfamily)